MEVSDDLLQMYLNQINEYQLLTHEEELHYGKLVAEQNSEWAKKMLVESNLRLVVSFAKRFVGNGVNIMDMIQEGNIGLMKAAEKFDYSKGFKFSTYASYWIKQFISRSIENYSNTVRIPVHMFNLMNRISRSQKKLMVELHREPTLQEIADDIGVDVEKVKEAESLTINQVSLDAPIGESEDTLGMMIPDDTFGDILGKIESSDVRQKIEQVMLSLDVREENIIRLRYGLDDGRERTLEEIGKVFNITRERVRQLEAKALQKLREPSVSTLIKGVL